MESEKLSLLVDWLKKLPGVGSKTAEKYAYFCLNLPAQEKNQFLDILQSSFATIKKCSVCCKYTEFEVCQYCSDTNRDHKQICIVLQESDLEAIEITKSYHGLYHVFYLNHELRKCLPLDENAYLSFRNRFITNNKIEEVILAIEPTLGSEFFVKSIEQLIPTNIKITRLAIGIPIGACISYIDVFTLKQALEHRIIYTKGT